MATAARRLKVARRRKSQIASLLHRLETGQVTLEQLLNDPPRCLNRVSVYTVMRRTPKLGPEGIKKCLTRAKVWPEDRMGNLNAEARQHIIDCLPPRATQRYRALN